MISTKILRILIFSLVAGVTVGFPFLQLPRIYKQEHPSHNDKLSTELDSFDKISLSLSSLTFTTTTSLPMSLSAILTEKNSTTIKRNIAKHSTSNTISSSYAKFNNSFLESSRSASLPSSSTATIAKRLTKQITKCGSNYHAALEKLCTSYPYLQVEYKENEQFCKTKKDKTIVEQSYQMKSRIKEGEDTNETNHLDWESLHRHIIPILLSSFRPIGATIDLLGKVNQPYIALKLFHRILYLIQCYYDDIVALSITSLERSKKLQKQQEEEEGELVSLLVTDIDHDDDYGENQTQKKQHEPPNYFVEEQGSFSSSMKEGIPTKQIISFLYLLYKSIIGMIGSTIPKQQRLLQEKQKQLDESTDNFIKNKSSLELNGEYIVQLLYYDLPMKTLGYQRASQSLMSLLCGSDGAEDDNKLLSLTLQPPPIDLYHNTMSSLGKCKRMDLIIKIIKDMESKKRIDLFDSPERKSTMIPCTYYYQLPKPDRTAYATALTAAVRSKAYHESLHLLQSMKENKIYPNVLAYNQVLTCISNSGSVFDKNSSTNDRNLQRYELTNTILKEMESSYDSSVNSDLNNDNNVEYRSSYPTEATYKIIMAIYAKENKWDDIAKIKQKMTDMNIKSGKKNDGRIIDSSSDVKSTLSQGDTSVENIHGSEMSEIKKSLDKAVTSEIESSMILGHMSDLKRLEKMNKRRPVWYKLGKYVASEGRRDDMSFYFGIQTHRNPTENGLSLVFYEVDTEQKIGYMLIRNTSAPNPRYSTNTIDQPQMNDFLLFSKFMGMYIDEKQRGKKLATKFMAVWLLICHKSNALPTTEIINKPLLSLVLTKFGFLPTDESCIEVEVSPISNIKDKPKQRNLETGWFPEFAMYSKHVRPYDGTFGERELRIQKMMVTKYPPNPRGKITYVKTCFDHPLVGLAQSVETSDEILRKVRNELEELIFDSFDDTDRNKTDFFANDDLLRRCIFGYLFQR